MTSLSELSSAVKQTDEDSTKQFIRQLIINAEEHILLHHVNKLLAVPMFQNIIQIPTPEPSGQIKKGFAETCYSTTGWPYKLGSRIIGPRGCTVKAIQVLCGCSIRLIFLNDNLLKIQILVEADYESIVKFKIWKAFQLIYCLLRIDPSGEDMVKIIQFDDLKFYENQVEIIKNCFTTQQPYHSDINDASAVSSNDYSVVKRFSLEMLNVLERHMVPYHMNKLLELPMFRDIFSIPSPAASGRVKLGYAKRIYSALNYPFNIASRIMGPRGLTIKVIQILCGCRIQLRWKKMNVLQITVFTEKNFESTVNFKLWRAFECINRLLKIPPTGEDVIKAIQFNDWKFYKSQYELHKIRFPNQYLRHSDLDSVNVLLCKQNSATIQNVLNMFTKLEENMLLYHMKNLLSLPMLQNILYAPHPRRSGEIKEASAMKIYSARHYPFDVAGRIIGPHGLTVKAIEKTCECRIHLKYEKENTWKVTVLAENDVDSILKFKIWKSFQCIDYLLKVYPYDEDFVGAIQYADSRFWERQMEIIYNSLPAHDSHELLLNEHDVKSLPQSECCPFVASSKNADALEEQA
ncbi:Protein quaking [Trichinella pseudospiralis]|uniref:Protein quaking n=2 Tax=Trichinella pseudospiralis TaxID=6337 RepID=A0A0V1IYU8_TRIPS|nr:Protein quaking [Trichinella pseudospiralis]KRZ43156.1 Protein quaking [Trichinella pseudospiralis]